MIGGTGNRRTSGFCLLTEVRSNVGTSATASLAGEARLDVR